MLRIIKKIGIISAIMLMIMVTGCKDNTTNPTSNGGGNPGANEIWMVGSAYNPASKTVSAGTTLTWINKDQTLHTVTSGLPGSPDGQFNSGNLNNGGTFSHTFSNAGTFKYFCLIHGSMMTGTVVVQ